MKIHFYSIIVLDFWLSDIFSPTPEPAPCAEEVVMTGPGAALVTDDLGSSSPAFCSQCHGQMAKNTSSVTLEPSASSRDQAEILLSLLLASDLATLSSPDWVLWSLSWESPRVLTSDQIPASPDIPALISSPTLTGSEMIIRMRMSN